MGAVLDSETVETHSDKSIFSWVSCITANINNKYKMFFYMLLAIHVPSSTLIFRFECRTWNESGVFPIILGHHIYIYTTMRYSPQASRIENCYHPGKNCDFSRDTVAKMCLAVQRRSKLRMIWSWNVVDAINVYMY